MKKIFIHLLILIAVFLNLSDLFAQKNSIIIETNKGEFTISRHIYGHFAEHLGRCIYDGIWVGENSKIPNTRGIRNDVIEALKALRIPNLRWPGGCFADTYHWRDGIGAKETRPPMVNFHWGKVVEDNSFGTHEFLDLCEQLGCEAYISANVGSGTVREMSEWLEYITSDKDVPLADLRKKNGRNEPWRIKFWGIGNESWGCGGNMLPEYYADLYGQFAAYCINYHNKDMVIVACGASDSDYNWTDVVMKKRQWMLDSLSLHYYTVPGGWESKHPAVGFDEQSYFEALQKGLRIEEILREHIAVMDKYDPEKRVGLMVDEWGIWCAVEKGTNPSFLYQQNSMRDALLAAATLNIFNRYCERVKMANIAQTVNVLQAMILTENEKMVLTPTYHVFEMYKVHQDAVLLPVIMACSDYSFDEKKIPALNVSASRDKNGNIHITINNLHPAQPQEIVCELRGKIIKDVTGRILTAKAFNTCNTFDDPGAVVPQKFENIRYKDNIITLTLSPFTVLVLEVQM